MLARLGTGLRRARAEAARRLRSPPGKRNSPAATGEAGHPGAMSIEVRGLTKVFETGRRRTRRRIEAVRDISFSVEPGERIAYIGPNGAGKSTSIKILTGILHPTSGAATVLGIVPWLDRRRLAARIGTLFGQRSLLWFELTPRQSYRMLAAIYGLDRAQEEARVADLAK